MVFIAGVPLFISQCQMANNLLLSRTRDHQSVMISAINYVSCFRNFVSGTIVSVYCSQKVDYIWPDLVFEHAQHPFLIQFS